MSVKADDFLTIVAHTAEMSVIINAQCFSTREKSVVPCWTVVIFPMELFVMFLNTLSCAHKFQLYITQTRQTNFGNVKPGLYLSWQVKNPPWRHSAPTPHRSFTTTVSFTGLLKERDSIVILLVSTISFPFQNHPWKRDDAYFHFQCPFFLKKLYFKFFP